MTDVIFSTGQLFQSWILVSFAHLMMLGVGFILGARSGGFGAGSGPNIKYLNDSKIGV